MPTTQIHGHGEPKTTWNCLRTTVCCAQHCPMMALDGYQNQGRSEYQDSLSHACTAGQPYSVAAMQAFLLGRVCNGHTQKGELSQLLSQLCFIISSMFQCKMSFVHASCLLHVLGAGSLQLTPCDPFVSVTGHQVYLASGRHTWQEGKPCMDFKSLQVFAGVGGADPKHQLEPRCQGFCCRERAALLTSHARRVD
jgi:hypothetical protein